MNTKRVEEKFKIIGAELVWREVSPRPYWRRDTRDPYTMRVGTNQRGHEHFVVEAMARAREHLTVTVPCVDKRRKALIVSMRCLEEHKRFLCRMEQRRWRVDEIPPGTAGGFRHADNALAQRKAAAREEATVPTRDGAPGRRGKSRRRLAPPPVEEVRDRVTMDSPDYAFYERLIEKCRRLKLSRQGNSRAVAQYRKMPCNTFEHALMRVAARSARVRQPLTEWRAASHNPHKQFASLVRHLFATYPLPDFMDTVWFREDPAWIDWFIALGAGGSVRRLDDFPLAYTKKMSHLMMQAPSGLTVEQAIRWGQVRALGGGESFFRAMEHTRLAALATIGHLDAQRQAFWQTAMAWFLRHPMLDPVHYGPIIDFVEHQRFAPPRASPDFQITGRSPQALLQLVRQWHGALGTANRSAKKTWPGHGLDWRWEQMANGEVRHAWEVREILDSHGLLEEGKRMHHCVYTYTASCVRGRSVILSLRRDGVRTLTIEYRPEPGCFGEVRGVCNRCPTEQELNVLQRWARARGLHRAWLLLP